MGKEPVSKYKGKTKTQLIDELESLNRRVKELEKSKTKRAVKGEEAHTGEYYKTLIENALDVIIVLDEKANIKYKSPSFDTMYGEGRKGRSPFDSIYPEDMAHAMEMWEKVLQKTDAVIRTEMRGLHRSGETRHFAAVARNMLHDPTVEGIVVVFQDITERKQAEEALERSREYFRAIIESSLDVIIIIDDKGNIKYKSPSFADIVVKGPKGQGQPFDFIYPEDMPKAMELWEQIMQKPDSVLRTEIRGMHKSGGTGYYAVAARNLLRNPAVEGIVVVFRDITERKQSEEALELSESRFRALIENAMDAIVIIGTDGTILYGSPATSRFFGWTKKDAIGTDPFRFVHEEDIQRTAEVFANLMITPGAVVKEELRFWHKDGSLLYTEVTGQNLRDNPAINGIVANMRDITDRKKAEEELEKHRRHLEELVEGRTAELKKANEDLQAGIAERERIQDALQQSEEKLRAIFDSIGDALIVTDLTGTIVEANEAALRIGGYSSKDEIVGRNSVELIAPGDVASATEYMAKAFKEGLHVTIEHKMLTKDGREIDVEASGAMLRNMQGKPVGVVSIAKDITGRKRMQEDLLLKEGAVEHAINAIAFSDMEGNITYVNQACLQLWGGVTKGDLIGKPYWEMIDVESEELLKEIVTSVLKNQRWEGEVASRKKDGSKFILHVSTGIVNDSSGNPIQTVSSFIDITRYKKA